MLERYIDSAAATEALGSRLATALAPGCVLNLRGELGAGKTTLARGLLRGLGHAGTVKSPTFTLVEPYQLDRWRLFHWDLYRLTDPEELEYLGLRDQLDGEAALLIEWPERGRGELPAADLDISLDYASEGRTCRMDARSPAGHAMLAALAEQPHSSAKSAHSPPSSRAISAKGSTDTKSCS